MTLNQLEYFCAIASRENFRAAAEVLHVSQPSLSRSIAQLEEELHVALFEKKGRGVVLTKAGSLFYESASKTLKECDQAKEKMQEIASGGGVIDIGYIFPLAGHYIPHHVRSFLDQSDNENITFTFWQSHTPAILEKLRKGELDLGFGGCVDDLDLDHVNLFTQELIIVTPEDHPLSAKEKVELAELENYPVIGYDKECWMGRKTRSLYEEYGLHPNVIVECPDEYSILSLVRENFGIALIPRTDICRDFSNVILHSIEGELMAHQIMMFWLKDREHLPAVDQFIEYMKEQARLCQQKDPESLILLRDMNAIPSDFSECPEPFHF